MRRKPKFAVRLPVLRQVACPSPDGSRVRVGCVRCGQLDNMVKRRMKSQSAFRSGFVGVSSRGCRVLAAMSFADLPTDRSFCGSTPRPYGIASKAFIDNGQHAGSFERIKQCTLVAIYRIGLYQKCRLFFCSHQSNLLVRKSPQVKAPLLSLHVHLSTI